MAESGKTIDDRVRVRAYALWERMAGPTTARTNTGSGPDPKWRPRRPSRATSVRTMRRRNASRRLPRPKRRVEHWMPAFASVAADSNRGSFTLQCSGAHCRRGRPICIVTSPRLSRLPRRPAPAFRRASRRRDDGSYSRGEFVHRKRFGPHVLARFLMAVADGAVLCIAGNEQPSDRDGSPRFVHTV
jgi:hypothetical protein